ncbi:hypothetical protein [Actinacidiphila oryziradicis]|uniref:Uncharacterized protein n=1 Tax=Actinacidiphila oryziradicis TaxID=2571141 RepID=A0A4V5MYN1_9ACTN|nr:hypothetical protein [Actinacidiphila oryziradicis]TJZ99308.1 hypothetical protein FCI23_46325 [Actinacidiphila oryziradicis]
MTSTDVVLGTYNDEDGPEHAYNDEDGPEHALYVTRDHSWHGVLWSSALVTEDRPDKIPCWVGAGFPDPP